MNQELLQKRVEERNMRLERIAAGLQADPRVSAAWLTGSLGRGSADAFSDLDIWVIVEDAYIDAFRTHRRDHVSHQEEALVIIEAPQNAPPGGAFLSVLYADRTGPHEVDWNWQSLSLALRPPETRLLFERVPVPRRPDPHPFAYQPVPEVPRLEAVSNSVCFFWLMLLIAAKYAARSPFEEKMGLLGYAETALQEVSDFLGEPERFAFTLALQQQPADKLAILRAMAVAMRERMPKIKARGGRVPKDDGQNGIGTQAEHFFQAFLVNGVGRSTEQ